MSESEFRVIIGKFSPHKESMDYLTLHGCGEPLLDPTLGKKVRLAKDLGFNGTGFATNCTELNETMARTLIEAGLDTIICSIDGVNAVTHESIRLGTKFSQVVSNVKRFIRIRNQVGKTRVMVRFIRQSLNFDEWPEFKKFWDDCLDNSMGDEVVKFDIHNWGGQLVDCCNEDHACGREISPESLVCQDVFERMLIYSDGRVGLCCADDNGFHEFGNVLDDDPLTIYNNPLFSHYRKLMVEGRILELDHCCDCTIPRSRYLKDQLNDSG